MAAGFVERRCLTCLGEHFFWECPKAKRFEHVERIDDRSKLVTFGMRACSACGHLPCSGQSTGCPLPAPATVTC